MGETKIGVGGVVFVAKKCFECGKELPALENVVHQGDDGRVWCSDVCWLRTLHRK